MRFSIITITYNAEAYLNETLTSVISQTFTDYEHIIWDGGSTDNTLNIIKSYPHVKLYQGKDLGISDAMNKGASFAKGQFLLHLHADDLLAHPNALLFADSALKMHPEAYWLYGLVNIIDEKGIKKSETRFSPYSYKKLKKYNCISHPATFISRQLFEKSGGFDTSLRYCMDYDMWLKIGKEAPGIAVPIVFSSFREHASSLSTSLPREVAKEAYAVRNRYCNLLERYRSKKTYMRRIKKLFQLET